MTSLISSSSTRGRNSWSGGSSRRTVTGRPSMASRISMKSAFWTWRSSSSAFASSSGVRARIMRRTTGRRSSPRNMCSVRHRPMPSAPNSRAFSPSGPLSALARTSSLPRRTSSAQLRMMSNSGGGSAAASIISPRMISPVVPSIEMMSPSATTMSPTVKLLAADLDGLRADHGRRAPAPGDDGGVRHQAAARGEDALRDHHPVHVLGARLAAHEDDVLAPVGGVGRVVGGEVDLAHGGARRGAEALGDRRGLVARTAGAAPGRGGRR